MSWTAAFAATFEDPQLVHDNLPRSARPNIAFPDEVLRVRVPAPPPPMPKRLCRTRWPVDPIPFTDDGRGISMTDLLTKDPVHLLSRMGSAWRRPCPTPREFILKLSWPGYPQWTRWYPEGQKHYIQLATKQYYEIPREVARAYQKYMTEATNWSRAWYGTAEDEAWRVWDGPMLDSETAKNYATYVYLRSMHLVALHAIDDFHYTAEVHEVIRPIEFPEPDLFWESFELVK